MLAELNAKGYCILKSHFAPILIDACREALWPLLLHHIATQPPNRGPHRHFFPMPFSPPAFVPEFFFDPTILQLARAAMDDRIVADQWGCDTPVLGSTYQDFHIDYRHPLFPESPDLPLPTYMLVVSFGLVPITRENGPLEIAPYNEPILLQPGDVLIRYPWTLHRGTPNLTGTPRPLVTIRYVRSWYADNSRDVNHIPREVWNSLTPEQQQIMRFPVVC